MTPEARFMAEVDRMFGILLHPSPVPIDERTHCADCGIAVHEADAMWISETMALCDRCEAERERADNERARA